MAVGADHRHRALRLAAQFLGIAHACLAVAQHIPGQRVLDRAERHVAALAGRRRVLHVGVVQEADRVVRGVVQHDEEVVRVHQPADDGVDATQHRGHVAFGTGKVGNREQCPLQVLRALQLLMRMLQVEPFQRPLQAQAGQPQQRRQPIEEVVVRLCRLQAQHQHGRFGQLAQTPCHALPVRMPLRRGGNGRSLDPGPVFGVHRHRRHAAHLGAVAQSPQHTGGLAAGPFLHQRRDHRRHFTRRTDTGEAGQPGQLQRVVDGHRPHPAPSFVAGTPPDRADHGHGPAPTMATVRHSSRQRQARPRDGHGGPDISDRLGCSPACHASTAMASPHPVSQVHHAACSPIPPRTPFAPPTLA
ncbi:hypothetical protein RLIN73S_00696 [Rhodanobacter lindaniclasticus]